MTEIFVPESKYREIGKKVSCGTIVDSGTCHTFHWNNVEYVATGACGSGNGKDWALFWAKPIVDLSMYKGDLVPLKYRQHFDEVDAGRRERGYIGMLVKSGARQLVFVGPEVEFKKLEVGKQLTIF